MSLVTRKPYGVQTGLIKNLRSTSNMNFCDQKLEQEYSMGNVIHIIPLLKHV